ncbi:TetR/AcrR family transcriptional regulator [Rhizobium grahamii]|uniref:TetR/AcrR family transcriptional regulator n=1 Tax=Rhizobium grahamii TaxID=1120045 RepID=A0A5Q0C9P9_9HYPH|nr:MULTISPECIES: TetR/AcrR family transcriptional regulator [Rhizobium]QFY61134.1 TetR/AcrR family transcriptional regulator [Rhizobium grahamii]QRM49713.1 TetR/AcrR family transcriptional regulator [Rhizobium sp. BG6]
MARMVAERADAIAPLAEVFREHGYEGASLALIGKATGLGKGSLYHFFPNGKEEMVRAVLGEIGQWFEDAVYSPLRNESDVNGAIRAMLASTDQYFRSGRRVCLVGALAVANTRDLFAQAIRGYFVAWVDALQSALIRQGREADQSRLLAEEAVLAIQGAIILSRAMDDPTVFQRAIDQLRRRLVIENDTSNYAGTTDVSPQNEGRLV